MLLDALFTNFTSLWLPLRAYNFHEQLYAREMFLSVHNFVSLFAFLFVCVSKMSS